CQIKDFFFINQPPALTLNLVASSPTACANTSISISGTATGGTGAFNYAWTGGPLGATNTAIQSLGGNYVYTLSALDANNCPVSNTILTTFIPLPTLNIGPPSGFVSICPFETGTITVSGATTYTWSNSSNNAFLIDSPLQSTQYN